MSTEEEARAEAVREARRYIDRIHRNGLVPLGTVLADLDAVAYRMAEGMTARGNMRRATHEPCDHDWQNRVGGGSKCTKCDLWQDKRVTHEPSEAEVEAAARAIFQADQERAREARREAETLRGLGRLVPDHIASRVADMYLVWAAEYDAIADEIEADLAARLQPTERNDHA